MEQGALFLPDDAQIQGMLNGLQDELPLQEPLNTPELDNTVEQAASQILTPETTPVVDSQTELEDWSELSEGSDGLGMLRRYGYSGLSVSFDWGEDVPVVQDNPGAIGGCGIRFTVNGATPDIAAVLIAMGVPMSSWTDDDILRQADFIIPIWKEAGGVGIQNIGEQWFPIMQEELGVFGLILLFVLDENTEALGHVIVPVQIPSNPD